MTTVGVALRGRERAFSLLELLVVLAIVAALTTAGLAGFGSMMLSTALGTGADQLRDALGAAQHAAVTQNLPVEVRFYAVPGPGGMGSYYRAVQARALNPDGSITPVAPVMTLPAGVTIDPTAAHSPLIGSNPATATNDPSDPLLNGQTRVFHFLPDGSTDLPAATSWFVTLRAATASDPANFPSNWACLALDPTTGRAQIYRP
jgi:uncharacterized protein (TIGR02596 family)